MSKGQAANKSKKKSGTTTRKPNSGQFKPGNTIGKETRIKPGTMLTSKYDDSYPEDLIKYFLDPNEIYPTFVGWAKTKRICIETAEHWANDPEKYPLFSEAYRQCRAINRDNLEVGGATGRLNPNIVKFLLSAKHGLSEKTTTDNTVTFAVRVSEEVDEESN